MKERHSCFLIFNTALATILLVVLGIALAFRLGGYQISAIFSSLSQQEPLVTTRVEREVVSEETAIIDVVEAARPSVVSILVGKVSWNPVTGPEKIEGGVGTGFIVDSDGLILTNRHVVSDSSASYTVVLDNDEEYQVQDIYRDAFNDLAILKIDAQGLESLQLGDSDALRVGQKVVAIGNALGEFPNAVTSGIVSGIGRGITAATDPFGGTAQLLEDVIQTDAALNLGNSGGPLLNLSAEVVGINVAMTQGAENIGFAIPVNTVKPTLENFEKHGRIVRPFLGISYVIISSEIAETRDLPEGAYVREVVAASPAEESGLQPSDIITKIDNTAVNENQTLAEIIAQKSVGDEITMEVYRNGNEITLKAELVEAPTD
ncbi:MAG: trypsin-like peptidase domain-containing protein [Patescibacteria group bacterium]|nr:trypsin-like peptidase domain-containing protein [Patescibacteria group bacterium]